MPRLSLIPPLLAALLAVLPAGGAAAQDATPAGAEDAGAYLAARVAESQDDYRQAAAWYARALERDPANAQLLEGAVLSVLGLGDIPAAAEYARRLLAAGANSQAAYLAIHAERAGNGEFAQLSQD
ncbi:MAG: hypothetical protein RIR62_35, partial [Pseudomonadota bacterium]